MTDEEFWAIVESAAPGDDDWSAALVARLGELPDGSVLAFDRILDRLVDEAYGWDLWGAAYLINGGCSDDGFYYFRGWLIAQGRAVYTAALADPDSLADAVDPDADAECESIHQAGMTAREHMAGGEVDYERANAWPAGPYGERWDFESDTEVNRRLPRLAALYLE